MFCKSDLSGHKISGWVVPKKHTSLFQAQSVFNMSDSDPLMKLLLSLDPNPVRCISSAPAPIKSNRYQKRSKVDTTLVKVQSDALSSADHDLLNDIIFALMPCHVNVPADINCALAAAALVAEEREYQTAWFSTAKSDEFELDAVIQSEDASSVFISRASLNDLRPNVVTTCK